MHVLKMLSYQVVCADQFEGNAAEHKLKREKEGASV